MILEDVVVCSNPKYPLKGILTIPESNDPVPAVVFVHGTVYDAVTCYRSGCGQSV